MNSGYTKLFGDILTSTIWAEDNDCKVLWITMLALKEKDHICRATVPGLSKLSDVPIKKVEEYLQKFQKPDKHSRSQEHEGRRIAPVDGGWLILNGPKYQDRLNAEDRKEQVKAAVRRHRERVKELEQQSKGNGTLRAPGTSRKAKKPTDEGQRVHDSLSSNDVP